MSRGILTEDIKQISKKFLGREISQKELRLYPYIQFCLMNDRRLDPRRVDQEEREILSLLREEGHIEGGASYNSLGCTYAFWRYISRVLWLSYAKG